MYVFTYRPMDTHRPCRFRSRPCAAVRSDARLLWCVRLLAPVAKYRTRWAGYADNGTWRGWKTALNVGSRTPSPLGSNQWRSNSSAHFASRAKYTVTFLGCHAPRIPVPVPLLAAGSQHPSPFRRKPSSRTCASKRKVSIC